MTSRLSGIIMRATAPFLILAAVFAISACSGEPSEPAPADMVLTGGRIYTANAGRAFVEAIAVSGDEIVFAGTSADARAYIGPQTEEVDLAGRLALPGLHDTHIHPDDAMAVESCNLDNAPLSLAEISGFVDACRERFAPAENQWLVVEQWNYYDGNAPDDRFATMRQALDAVSNANPIILLGSDGHHYAANSAALATARAPSGETVGISRQTLANEFSDIADYFGVDGEGRPDGKFTEDYAFEVLDAAGIDDAALAARLAQPELLMDVTLPHGITSFLDASVTPKTAAIYDALLAAGRFRGRATLAIYLDLEDYRGADGAVDFDALLADAAGLRDKYAANEFIKADFLKLFADGVLEGDPYATPPTLPNAALSRDYRQPVFATDQTSGALRVAGYVDPDGEACEASRATNVDVAVFVAQYGFHPRQCAKNNGTLQHPREDILEFVKRGADAGYTFMIHAIGDRAVKTALDAIEAAQENGGEKKGHIVTHLQLVQPTDDSRFAALGVYASFTFAWAVVDPPYDMTVIPFIDRVDGAGGMYDPEGYYWSNVYPAHSIQQAGGVLIAGSDAPVDTRDPRPFVNIAGAVFRRYPGGETLNGDQAISIFDAVDAYTINAARAMKQADATGSLEAGKKADFIILDRDIFALAAAGDVAGITDAQVLETWFGGERVYAKDK